MTSGPPELPGLSGASVWITSFTWRPASERSVRPRALTTPAVTVYWNPYGLPMAITSWPTRIAEESPSGAATRSSPEMRTTARSVSGSAPTRRASNCRPSARVAVTVAASATAWLVVRMKPSGVKMKPEAAPSPAPSAVSRLTTAGDTASTASMTARE